MADLGNWLSERYRIPGPPDPDALGDLEAGGDEPERLGAGPLQAPGGDAGDALGAAAQGARQVAGAQPAHQVDRQAAGPDQLAGALPAQGSAPGCEAVACTGASRA